MDTHTAKDAKLSGSVLLGVRGGGGGVRGRGGGGGCV